MSQSQQQFEDYFQDKFVRSRFAEDLFKIENPNHQGSIDPKQTEAVLAEALKTQSLEEIYFRLTTTRNRELLLTQEQRKLSQIKIVVFGLSVGSNAALTWATESRTKEIRIVDLDTIDPSNLNRLRAGWDDIGKYKVDVVQRELLRINPYCKVLKTIDVSLASMEKMVKQPDPVDIIVDECDSMEGKVLLRKLGSELGIPVISACDFGDIVFIDIERYDLDNNYPCFHGLLSETDIEAIPNLPPMAKKAMAIKLVGFKHASERLLKSLINIGQTIPTWPQLGSTAAISGGIISTTIRKIVLGETIPSGRYYHSLESLLVKDWESPARQAARSNLTKRANKRFYFE